MVYIITLGAGIIIGILVGWFAAMFMVIKYSQDRSVKDILEHPMYTYKGKSQFFEPVSDKERFDKATNIGDIL